MTLAWPMASALARTRSRSNTRSATIWFLAFSSSPLLTGSARRRSISSCSAASPASRRRGARPSILPLQRRLPRLGLLAALQVGEEEEHAGILEREGLAARGHRDLQLVDQLAVEPRALALREDAARHLQRIEVGVLRRRHVEGEDDGRQRRLGVISHFPALGGLRGRRGGLGAA